MAVQGGFDPIASGLLRIAIRGRSFLSEHANDDWFCYYKGGLAEGVTRCLCAEETADYASLIRPTGPSGAVGAW